MAKIMVVDDSKMFRMVASAPLVEAGHQVEQVDPASLFDVMKHLYEFSPDLVITDYRMPNCSGETLIRAIREDPTFRLMKILVLSSHSEEELVERLGHYGLEGYLLKGQGMQTLVERVGEILPVGSPGADA